MTRSANARLAGAMFLAYIATGVTTLVLSGRMGGEGTARLAGIAQHASLERLIALLTLLTCVEALTLAVTLYALTREHDPDVALLALAFRLGEGFNNAVAAVATLDLLAVATAGAAAATPDAAAANALGAMLLKGNGSSYLVGASLFAVGSTLYAWVFLRARSIPVALARLGVIGSLLLVAALPAQMLGLIRSPWTEMVWIPVAVFEVTFGVWLLIKGGAPPR
jgi:hypothetical protein